MDTITEKFRAMGTDVFVSFVNVDEEVGKKEIEVIKGDIENFEQRFSRFRKDSELSSLNDFTGEKFEASPEMISMFKEAEKAYQKTNKIFDPTVLSVLEKLGYDRSFEIMADEDGDLEKKSLDVKKIQKDFLSRKSFSDIEIIDGRFIRKPLELKVDFGGIGKGYIMDKIAADLKKEYENFWISAGGDMFLSGKDVNGNFWKVGVQNPADLEKDIKNVKVILEDMSIATSGTMKRRWMKEGFKWHHIIDPRTGLPAENDILSVTVVASSVMWADVFAKTVLILGKEEGIDFINGINDAECLIVDKRAELFLSKNMEQYLA